MKASDLAQRLEAEKAVNQKRIADLSAAAKVEETTEGEATEGETTEEPLRCELEEIPADEPKADPTEEAAPEAKVEETPEETVLEASATDEPKACHRRS